MRHARRASRIGAAALVALLFGAAGAHAADIRLGYIDSSRIFIEFKEAQEAQQRFDRLVTGWRDETKVDEYLSRVGRVEARAAGEAELEASLPPELDRVLDLGCGDGALAHWGSVLIAALAVGALGALVEVALLKRLYAAPELLQLTATFGIVLVVRDATLAAWGAEDLPGLATATDRPPAITDRASTSVEAPCGGLDSGAQDGRSDHLGADGQLGQALARALPAATAWTADDFDLCRPAELLLRLRGQQPRLVINCAALTDVDACERDPELAWRANVAGTAEVAGACRALGARLLALSTDYVFDGEAGPYGEDDRPNPRGAYARSKRCGEEAALLLAPGAAVARVAVVYGGRPGAKPTFATQVVEKLTRGEKVLAFSDQHVSTTLASSGAAMCLELLLETSYAGVLHACDEGVLDREAFARAVAARFGLTGEIVPVRTAEVNLPAPRPLLAGLKVERAAALLRNKPLRLAEALDRFHAEWQLRAAGRP